MRETTEVIAGFLRVGEADMLAELLASAGIAAWVQGAVAGSLGPALVPGAGNGAQLRVAAADAARARELVAESGLLAGGRSGPVAVIPDAVWAAPPRPETEAHEAAPDVRARRAWAFLLPLFAVGAALIAAWFSGRR